MTRVIFVNRFFYPDMSATSQMLTELAFALADGMTKVAVVASRQSYENPKESLPARQVISGIEIYRVWTTRFGRRTLFGRTVDYISFYFSAFWVLLWIAHSNDVIVAKTDPPLISVVAWVVAKAKRAQLVNWLQDVFPEVAAALGVLTFQPLLKGLRLLRDLSLKGAAMNVVLGQRMQAFLCAQGVQKGKITVIHNWADGSLIKPVPPEKNALRKTWGLQGKLVVGYSGNMGRAHDFETIIGAMRRLQDEKDIVFLFIGGGAGKQRIERAVGEYALTNCVFKSYQPRDRLAASLSVPDVHLVSLQPQLESLIVPSKIYGIAAAGRPVIFVGDPAGEIGCLLSRFDFGASVQVGAEAELEQHLRTLKQMPERLESMGRKARRCFEAEFDKAHGVKAWKRVLVALAG